MDIMRDKRSEDLSSEIIQGLQFDGLRLPQVLLWDNVGQRLFDDLTRSPGYYLTRKEEKILRASAHEMAATIPAGSALIELGCGSLQKSGIVLSAIEKLQKPVSYYALDLSLECLQKGLAELQKGLGCLRSVQLHGLCGTYDDAISWLADQGKQPPNHAINSVTILWMGNSITNMGPFQAQSLLSQLGRACSQSGIRCQFLVSVDGCTAEDTVMAAYSTNPGPFRDFMMNGLESANRLLGEDVFRRPMWTFDSVFDRTRHEVQMSYTPTRDVTLCVNGHEFKVSSGEKIAVVTSGKWPAPYFRSLVEEIGLQVDDLWGDGDQIYYFYRISMPS
ncbi:hypothetical protein FE257_010278 [Aspergillus nanangensis]|uniref:Histidine-specific methyltransferase SAM-dependent domain-containing protein n=1 Tax=Aspergillus nanangensis TaxID=2582783 RepID=A0AAD4CJL8_ASPNN|nr:hypothetical protein FE257_010278 [Aspergillus nanangensis]